MQTTAVGVEELEHGISRDVVVVRRWVTERFDPYFGDVGHDEGLDTIFGRFEGVEIVDEDPMCRFPAVADHRRCIVRDGKVVWTWIVRTGECVPPRCRVECRELEKSDEVVVVDTGDDEFVVLEVVEERVQHLRDVEDVVVRGFADDRREFGGGGCEEQRSCGSVC